MSSSSALSSASSSSPAMPTSMPGGCSSSEEVKERGNAKTPRSTQQQQQPRNKPKRKLPRKQQQQQQQERPQRRHRFYGDIVNGLFMGVMTPSIVRRMFVEQRVLDPEVLLIVFFCGLGAVFQILAWDRDSVFYSRMGFLANVMTGLTSELFEWPFKGVCAINQLCVGVILLLCMANVTLSVREKVIRMAVTFAATSYASVKSPYSNYKEDTVPYLWGSILISLLGLYLFHNSDRFSIQFQNKTSDADFKMQRDEFVVYMARWILAAIYTYYALKIAWDAVMNEVAGEDTMDQIKGLLKAMIVAGVGSVATGVFKTNIEQKEQLEVLVSKRTNEIHQKNIELRRINFAFEASKTAIAITDASRSVLWANPAFELLGSRTRRWRRRHSSSSSSGVSSAFTSSIGRQLTDAIVLDGQANETKLRGAFDFSVPREDEIEINRDDDNDDDDNDNDERDTNECDDNGRKSSATRCQYRVNVTPFVDCDADLDDVLSTDSESDSSEKSFGSKLFLVAFHDITADRAREQAENKFREEALLSEAMKESMVTLTHELRTPLQGIMGITSLLLEQHDFAQEAKQQTASSFSKDAFESLGLIMASSNLLLNLINNLLDVKKADANMMDDFVLSPLLASGPIRDAIDFCNPLASISNVKIAMNCRGATAGAYVNANALRLQQVLINMISNAIKYTDKGSTIGVSTRSSTVGETKKILREAVACCSSWEEKNASSSFVVDENTPVLIFSVSDAGAGIEKDQARRLFRQFAMLDKKATRTLGSSKVGQPSGTGLGLHLCQMFVQRMQGSIWTKNNDGRGSTFSFCLPMVSPPVVETPPGTSSFGTKKTVTDASVESRRGRLNSAGSMGHHESGSFEYDKLRILVVDDTLINRKVLDRMLKKIGIVRVTTVDSGRGALKELFSSDKTYDMVITDLQMPGMSGMELTAAIFEEARGRWTFTDDEPMTDLRESLVAGLPSPPVVVGLTADTSPNVAERCAASGMSDLLHKPITLVEIKDYFQKTAEKLRPRVWRRRSER